MTDLNTSPHSPEKQREQRLYEIAKEIEAAWQGVMLIVPRSYGAEVHDRVEAMFDNLSAALAAYDGKAV